MGCAQYEKLGEIVQRAADRSFGKLSMAFVSAIALTVGLILGLTFRWTKNLKSVLLRYAIWAAAAVISSAAAMLLVKSGVECLLYAQPMAVRMAKNFYAFAADAFMLVVTLPLAPRLEPPPEKS